MSELLSMTERHAATLMELTEIGMVMARGLRADVEAAETPETVARAVAAFPRVARIVQQCVALEAKLAVDARREASAVQDLDRRDFGDRVRERRAKVVAWMQRAIAMETPQEPETVRLRIQHLLDHLNIDLPDEDLVDRPLGEVLGDLYLELGLSPPLREAGLDPDDPNWRETWAARQAERERQDADADEEDDEEDDDGDPGCAVEGDWSPEPEPPPEASPPEPPPPPPPEPYFRYSNTGLPP